MTSRIASHRRGAIRASRSGASVFEMLEDRRLLSASPVQLKAVSPGKILAGNTGTEAVVVHNLTADPLTESVTVSLAPSLDGTTAAGAYSTPAVTETLTLAKHGSATVKVPFIPPTTLAAGKYHTLATVVLGTDTITATAPGVYTLTLPPAPTITPTLVGHYTGLIKSTTSTSTGLFGTGTNTRVKVASFIWQTTSQTLTGLTGLFAVGSQQTTGTMTGSELNTGAIDYTLASADINYTIKGKVTANGQIITGTFKGTLVDNIFSTLNGSFKLTLQPS